jgi:hypothetical protein
VAHGQRLARVHSDAHAHRNRLPSRVVGRQVRVDFPGARANGLLRLDGELHGVGGTFERQEEAVAHVPDLDAATRREESAQDVIVLFEQHAERVAVLFPHRGRSLNVGEDKGHDAGWVEGGFVGGRGRREVVGHHSTGRGGLVRKCKYLPVQVQSRCSAACRGW